MKKFFQNTCTIFVNIFRIFKSKLIKAFQKSFSEIMIVKKKSTQKL